MKRFYFEDNKLFFLRKYYDLKQINKRNPAWMDEIKIRVKKELADKFNVAPMIAPISPVISQV